MPKFSQGRFTPRNPSKYIGDVNNIIYRSSWEKKVLLYLDITPSILKYSSEETVIPYISPVDNRMHRYFVDFTIMYKTSSGEIKRAIVEVKPFKQTMPPVTPKKKTRYYLNEVMTYSVNQAKWNTARKWADKNGFSFIILTEKDLKI
jgi:hypothetical protein